MATSSSGYSCGPPLDFYVSSSIEDSGSRFSSTLEKCPLCSIQRKTFYCKQCIQNGDFYHSNHRFPERFAEKQLHLLRLKNERKLVEEQCKTILGKHMQVDQVHSEITACRERIELLRLLIQKTRENVAQVAQGKPNLAELTKTNNERAARLPRYEDRVGKMEKHVKQLGTNVTRQRLQVDGVRQELKQVIRESIHQLIQYIFPISQVQPMPCEEDHDADDTVSALADATHTTYIRGRWVFTDSSGELQHCIVAPTMPGSGDYSAYSIWVAGNKNSVPGGSNDTVDHDPAFGIIAGLTYTTQLINVLAFYLDVRLPHKLCYSDFCGHEMADQQFACRVAKLNSNVLHLCFSQSVDPELLHPTHTLHNVLHLLNVQVSDLGRQGPLEVDPTLAQSLEDQLTWDLDVDEDSGSEEDSDNLHWEWEAVPHMTYPEVMGPSGTASQLTATQQATSMAGGLVTSAAASIVSIWRGWTGHR